MTNNNKLVQNFLDSQVRFDAVLDRVPNGGLDWAEKEGEWSIREVVHHVAEDCNVYAFIIERALAMPGCNVIFGEFPGNEPWGNGTIDPLNPHAISSVPTALSWRKCSHPYPINGKTPFISKTRAAKNWLNKIRSRWLRCSPTIWMSTRR